MSLVFLVALKNLHNNRSRAVKQAAGTHSIIDHFESFKSTVCLVCLGLSFKHELSARFWLFSNILLFYSFISWHTSHFNRLYETFYFYLYSSVCVCVCRGGGGVGGGGEGAGTLMFFSATQARQLQKYITKNHQAKEEKSEKVTIKGLK